MVALMMPPESVYPDIGADVWQSGCSTPSNVADIPAPLGRDEEMLGRDLETMWDASTIQRKTPLAPKQGSVDNCANVAVPQPQSPIAGTYALRTPRGKITSIACESCRKRKSKCDGARPQCNTCRSKNVSCVYDVADDGKTASQLRTRIRRLVRELEDLKSIVSLLTVAPDTTTALNLANELRQSGFAQHSVEEIKKALQEISEKPLQQGEQELMDASESGTAPMPPQSTGTSSSFDSSSHDDGSSREDSQACLPDNSAALSTFAFDAPYELSRFSFDCSHYRRTKRELLATAWDQGQVLGSQEIDVDSILLGFRDPQDSQPVSMWSSRMVNVILRKFPLPERLASAYLLTKMMRWLIWPSLEHMNTMPEYLVPLARRNGVPYSILIDLVPWPHLRQYLYSHPDEFVAGSLVGYVRFLWPFEEDACHYWDMETGCTRLTPLFQSSINDLNSWCLDPKALGQMPQLEAMIPIKVE